MYTYTLSEKKVIQQDFVSVISTAKKRHCLVCVCVCVCVYILGISTISLYMGCFTYCYDQVEVRDRYYLSSSSSISVHFAFTLLIECRGLLQCHSRYQQAIFASFEIRMNRSGAVGPLIQRSSSWCCNLQCQIDKRWKPKLEPGVKQLLDPTYFEA